MNEYLAQLGEMGRAKVRRESRRALRQAWPHRHTDRRAVMVITANVAMLRQLAA